MRTAQMALTTSITVLATCFAAAADLPRYSLPVGRRLTYTNSSEASPPVGGRVMKMTVTWQLTVVRDNPDGSRRLILRTSVGDAGSERERVTLAYADVLADGRVLPNKSLGMQTDLSSNLPPLPADHSQLEKGWAKTDDAKQVTLTYSPQPSAGNELVFTVGRDSVLDKIYLSTQKATIHFDRARGAVTAVETESSQDYGFHQKSVGNSTLDRDETLTATDAALLAAEYDDLFAAREEYDARMESIRDPANADSASAAARSALERARDGAKTDAVKGELERMLKNHERYAAHAKEDAARIQAVLDKPAAEWSATDIDGKPATLADYRGKVVVMDFWYRGCGWCMYAMPQVKQLAEDYRDKPVVVLGMNTDRAEKDARFVIDVMGLKYPTIKAEGIPEKFGVQGFPTLIVIDQEGIVRDVHVGYSTTLREEVGKKIGELLEKSGK